MGIEIEINSLEDMCDLMCYNKIPKRRKHMEPQVIEYKEFPQYPCKICGKTLTAFDMMRRVVNDCCQECYIKYKKDFEKSDKE